jgi:RimJ/RimL family protein N-acetyltransferase
LPTILAVIASNQAEIAERLAEAGAAQSLGPIAKVTSASVAAILQSLARDPQRIARLSADSVGICDGRGAQRVAMRLSPARARGGEPVWLRPATASDVDVIYEWQCQPETRRFGRNNAVPSRDEHEAWFAARLRNPASLLNIIMCGSEPAGTLRLDRLDPYAYEVSIVVSMSCYGRGLGLAALELARRLVPESQIKAEILLGNTRSEALFTRAGYKPEGCGWRSVGALLQAGRRNGLVN